MGSHDLSWSFDLTKIRFFWLDLLFVDCHIGTLVKQDLICNKLPGEVQHHPWRHSRSGWRELWAHWSSCSCPCSLQGSWIRWSLKALPTQTTLCFYDSVIWTSFLLVVWNSQYCFSLSLNGIVTFSLSMPSVHLIGWKEWGRSVKKTLGDHQTKDFEQFKIYSL